VERALQTPGPGPSRSNRVDGLGGVSSVLQVHNRYRQPGGEDRVVENVATALSGVGWRVETFQADNPSGLAAVSAMARSVWNKDQAQALGQRISSLNPDITHLHNTWFALSPSVAEVAHRAGPVVMTLHNFRLTCANAMLFRAGDVCERCVSGTPWAGFWLNCYRNPVSSGISAANIAIHRKRDTWNQNVDRFFALSKFARDIFIRAGIEQDRIRVVNNHVADPGHRTEPPSQSDYVLYVGRISEEKGVTELVDRWNRYGPANLRLVICGDGPLASKLTASGGITMKGWTSPQEVTELMLNARALIFSSRWYEGQPLTILEAFASGLPVLGSRLGGVSELLEFLGPEWQPRQDDEDEWREGFRLLTTDAVDQASREVRSRFLASHTESVVANQLIAGYRSAIANHPA
jgi:glycosyltransferase involved in cell wall biosynthesis